MDGSAPKRTNVSSTRRFLPEGTLKGHPNEQLYRQWAQDGHLRLCKGERIDVRQVGNDSQADSDADSNDDVALVRQLISKLPPKQRMVITMRDIEGLDSEEMQRVTGLTDINIRTLLSRARSTVRQQFKKLSAYEDR